MGPHVRILVKFGETAYFSRREGGLRPLDREKCQNMNSMDVHWWSDCVLASHNHLTVYRKQPILGFIDGPHFQRMALTYPV